ncbi:MAG TPA: R body protein [Blastocatellia bacterium]|nr:R body protein [Blastocatellia bacterium]
MAGDQDSTLPDDIRKSTAIHNVKSVSEQTALLSNLAYSNLITNVNLAQQNAVSHQQAMNQLQITVTAKVVNLIANLSPLEAAAAVKVDTGNDVAEMIAELKAALASFSPSPAPEPDGKADGK